MARQKGKVVRARKSDSLTDDDSLLVRSAESLGRVIGSLQRQVQGRSKRLSSMAEGALEGLPGMPRFDDGFGPIATKTRKRAGARKQAARKAATTREAAGARKRGAPSKKR